MDQPDIITALRPALDEVVSALQNLLEKMPWLLGVELKYSINRSMTGELEGKIETAMRHSVPFPGSSISSNPVTNTNEEPPQPVPGTREP